MDAPQSTNPSRKTNWIPNLSGRTDPIVEQAIRYLFEAIYHLRDTGEINAATKKTIETIASTVIPAPTVVKHIATQLSSGGSNPLNVTGLPGVLPNPQLSGPPIVTALPAAGDPLSVLGNTVIYQGIEYQYRAIPGGGSNWVVTVSVGSALSGALATFRTTYPAADYPPGTSIKLDEGPSFIIQDVSGTHHWYYYSGYQADVLANIPTASLVTDDAGYTFSATDYIQQYQWNGSQFHFQTNSGSGYTSYFGASAPTYGLWGLADGSNYDTSQDDGTISNLASPNLGAGYYYRR